MSDRSPAHGQKAPPPFEATQRQADQKAKILLLKQALAPVNNMVFCSSCRKSGTISAQSNGGTIAFRCISNSKCRANLSMKDLLIQLKKIDQEVVDNIQKAYKIANQSAKEAAATRSVAGQESLKESRLTPTQEAAHLEDAPITRRELAEILRNFQENIQLCMSQSFGQQVEMNEVRSRELEERLFQMNPASPLEMIVAQQKAQIERMEATIANMMASCVPRSYANAAGAPAIPSRCASEAQMQNQHNTRPNLAKVQVPTKPTLTEEQAQAMAAKARVAAPGQYVPYVKVFVQNFKSGPLGETRRTLRRLGVTASPIGLNFLGRSPTLEITLHQDKKDTTVNRLRALNFQVLDDVQPEDISLLNGRRFTNQTEEEKKVEAAKIYIRRVKKSLTREVRPSMRGFMVKELYRLNASPDPRPAQSVTRQDQGQWHQPAHLRRKARRQAKKAAKQAPGHLTSPSETGEQARDANQVTVPAQESDDEMADRIQQCKDLVIGDNEDKEADTEAAAAEDVELLDASWANHENPKSQSPDVGAKRIRLADSRLNPVKITDCATQDHQL
jgi:hypothetical protein